MGFSRYPSLGHQHVGVGPDFLDTKTACFGQLVEGSRAFHATADGWRLPLQKAWIRDGNADSGLPSDGERRRSDRSGGNIDRFGSGVAGSGKEQERGKRRASGQPPNR